MTLEYGYVSTVVHLPLIAQKRTVMPHYKNSGLVSMWVYKFFKQMISSSNFVAAIARLVVLAEGRIQPGTTSPFSSLLNPVTLTCALFSLWALLRKLNIRKESSIGIPASAHAQKGCYQLQGKSLKLTEHSLSVLFTLTVTVIVRFKINITVSFDHSVVSWGIKRIKRPGR